MALDSFEVDNGFYPKSLNDLNDQPANAPGWKGPYLKKGVPPDPWGNPYIFDMPGKHGNSGYDLMSCGPRRARRHGRRPDELEHEALTA